MFSVHQEFISAKSTLSTTLIFVSAAHDTLTVSEPTPGTYHQKHATGSNAAFDVLWSGTSFKTYTKSVGETLSK